MQEPREIRRRGGLIKTEELYVLLRQIATNTAQELTLLPQEAMN